MASFSAARTNLTSFSVEVHRNKKLGEGSFRVAYAGTYEGGNRNNQDAVCKAFLDKHGVMESEFYRNDFDSIDKAISLAEKWNKLCPRKRRITINRGDIMTVKGKK